MDIDYLLFLQNFRNATGNFLTPFMEWISHFAVSYLIIVPVLIYWCIDKKKGLYTLTCMVTCVALNAMIKLTACIYRPWIRDARVVPAGRAIVEATGYSFPSGHVTTSSSIFGGIAAAYGKKRKWIAVICVLLIIVIGFSRNYLGVHTPQDVILGLLIGGVVLVGMSRIFKYLEEHPEKEDILLLIGTLVGIGALIYITLKPYPMDYIDGKLLVDPQKMMKDGYKDIGQMVAFFIARFLEKRFVKFKETGRNGKGIAVALVGVVPLYLIGKKLSGSLSAVLGAHMGVLAAHSILSLFIVLIWPAVIMLVCGKKEMS